MASTKVVIEEIVFAPLLPPRSAASCSDRDAPFALDLDGAEKGSGKMNDGESIIIVETESSDTSAFGRAETLVVGESEKSIMNDDTKATNNISTSEDEPLEESGSTIADNNDSTCTELSCSKTCNGYHRITVDDYKNFASGWPQFAAFLNSSENFPMFRRFGRVHCRLLLHLQAEITALEKKLDELDKNDAQTPSLAYRLKRCSWDSTWDQEQKDIIEELKKKIFEYDNLLTKDNALRVLDRPPKHNYLHVFDWLFKYKILDGGQYNFINYQNDMVYTADRIRRADGFDSYVEKSLSKWHSLPWQRFFQSRKKGEAEKVDEECGEVIYFSNRKIVLVAKLIAILLSVVILLLPVFMLSVITMNRKIATTLVLIFVLTFAILMSLFADAKAEIVFISTCAYCAVLVTFLGNVQSNGGTATSG